MESIGNLKRNGTFISPGPTKVRRLHADTSSDPELLVDNPPPNESHNPGSSRLHDSQAPTPSESPPVREMLPQGLSRGTTTSGLFSHSKNIVLQNPIMSEVQNVHVHADRDEYTEVLSWQTKHILTGTSFDSFNHDSSPICHLNTRVAIRRRVHSWLHDESRDQKLLWVFGPAGVGKTAVMRAVAEDESTAAGTDCVAATVFFSKSDTNYLDRIFPTISYYLSLRNASYRAYMTELRRTDPLYHQKALEKQFEKLFVIPCSQRQVLNSAQPWAILLDGLDECRGTEDHDRGYEQAQCTVIRLISTFVREHPTVPLVWVVASRPEHYLTSIFSLKDISACTLKENITVDSAEACQDVERYLKSALCALTQQYPSHFTGSESWPSDDEVLKIARAGSGYFIFAAVLVRFIQDSSVGNPIDRLADVLSVVQKTVPSNGEVRTDHPFGALDMMYTEILKKILPKMYENTRRMLAYSLFRGPSYPLLQVCNIMGIPQHVAYAALQNLHSVLNIPPPDLAHCHNITTFHNSFSEFLLDPSRSKDFGISRAHLVRTVGEYWRAYFRVIQQASCGGVSSIKLAWQSGDLLRDEALRRRLFQEAQNCWACSLSQIRPFGPWVGLGGLRNFPVYVPVFELVAMLRQVDFSKLAEYMPSVGSVPIDFLDSLRSLCQFYPEEVKRSGLVEHDTLRSLDLNKVDPTKSLTRYRFLKSGLRREACNYDDLRSIGDFFASTPVMIWGCTSSTKGALFKIASRLEGTFQTGEKLTGSVGYPRMAGGTNQDKQGSESGAAYVVWEVYFIPYR